MPQNKKREDEQRHAAENAARNVRRELADKAWSPDPQSVLRTAVVIAAFFLDEARDHELADWLLCARPEHARAVATGVAVHALRRGNAAAWDALAAVGAMDLPQADDWYSAAEDFVWSPEPEWLTREASDD